jgi:hypothetical protein
MDDSKNNTDQWGQCPTGQLSQLVAQQQAQHRKRKLRTTGAVVAVLLLVSVAAVVTIQGWPQSEQFHHGGISCVEAQSLLPQYVVGKLDRQSTSSVKEHLAHCESCRKKHQEMLAGDRISPHGALVASRHTAPR